MKDQLGTTKAELADTADKLNKTHKHSHETEIKLGEEFEKSKTLAETLKLREETLQRKTDEIEDFEKRLTD